MKGSAGALPTPRGAGDKVTAGELSAHTASRARQPSTATCIAHLQLRGHPAALEPRISLSLPHTSDSPPPHHAQRPRSTAAPSSPPSVPRAPQPDPYNPFALLHWQWLNRARRAAPLMPDADSLLARVSHASAPPHPSGASDIHRSPGCANSGSGDYILPPAFDEAMGE